MVDFVWLVGFLASILITLSFTPQMIKMWKLRHEKLNEFHVLWFILNILGSLLFVYYGIMIGQIGLIILNTVGIVSLVFMLLIYLGAWRQRP
jgi:uncharacterized protein with PQ loop repeat